MKLLNLATFNCFRQFKTDIGLADQCIEEGNSDLWKAIALPWYEQSSKSTIEVGDGDFSKETSVWKIENSHHEEKEIKLLLYHATSVKSSCI